MGKRQVWVVEVFRKLDMVPRWAATGCVSHSREEARSIASLSRFNEPFRHFRVAKYVPEKP